MVAGQAQVFFRVFGGTIVNADGGDSNCTNASVQVIVCFALCTLLVRCLRVDFTVGILLRMFLAESVVVPQKVPIVALSAVIVGGVNRTIQNLHLWKGLASLV